MWEIIIDNKHFAYLHWSEMSEYVRCELELGDQFKVNGVIRMITQLSYGNHHLKGKASGGVEFGSLIKLKTIGYEIPKHTINLWKNTIRQGHISESYDG